MPCAFDSAGSCSRSLPVTSTEAAVDRLDEVVAEMERVAADADIQRYFLLDLDFEERVMEACPNKKLVAVWRNLGRPILRFRYFSLYPPGRLPTCSNTTATWWWRFATGTARWQTGSSSRTSRLRDRRCVITSGAPWRERVLAPRPGRRTA